MRGRFNKSLRMTNFVITRWSTRSTMFPLLIFCVGDGSRRNNLRHIPCPRFRVETVFDRRTGNRIETHSQKYRHFTSMRCLTKVLIFSVHTMRPVRHLSHIYCPQTKTKQSNKRLTNNSPRQVRESSGCLCRSFSSVCVVDHDLI